MGRVHITLSRKRARRIVSRAMYVPDMFREDRPEVLHDAVRRIGFATLITQGLEANHLPMLFQDGLLRGHVARANPVWKAGEGEALAIFLGPHAYVSPNWYPSKAETGKAVPTWNYITVHAKGAIRWIQDAEWLRANVTALSDMHEAGRSAPWKVSDAPASYVDGLLRAIVGFELRIDTLEGKYKLSQNRDATDRAGVRDAFEGEGLAELARLMDGT
jgi:transcriptional regulator